MSSHYYLIAQLPTLMFGKESPVTKDAFIAEAEKWLTEREMAALNEVKINRYTASGKDHPVYMKILQYEHLIRTDVAKWREAQKNDLDYKPSAIPAALLKEGTPLDAEMKLMRLRWDYIDEMMREHHFDFGYLILYYIQLQLLQRFFTFDKERGLEKFQKLYEVNE